ncbi:MAG: DUF2800 domain-containing protein, partial [Geminicoccales bacterium]
IVVEAEGNGQLRYYGAGCAATLSHEHGSVGIEVVIVQPRCEHPDGPVRRDRLTIDELNAWVDADLLPAIARADAPDAPLVDGAHCRFCPATTICPRLTELHSQLATVAEAAKDPAKEAKALEDYELSERLARIAPVKMFIRALEAEAFLRLQRGSVLPGWKLVPKKANRVLKDGAEVQIVQKWGDAAYERRLSGIPALEKLPGGKEFCSEWAYKPDAGVTLAPDTDKRDGVKVRSVIEDLRNSLTVATTPA